MSNNFKPTIGILNHFSHGELSCQKFGAQEGLSVGKWPITLDLAVEHVVHPPPHIPIGMRVHTRLGCNCERSHGPGHNCGLRLT